MKSIRLAGLLTFLLGLGLFGLGAWLTFYLGTNELVSQDEFIELVPTLWVANMVTVILSLLLLRRGWKLMNAARG